MYAKVTNDTIDQYPYTVGDLRRDNPNTSFPRVIPTDTLEEYGLVVVQKTPQPDFDQLTHRVKETTPVLESGVWKQVWTTEAYPDADQRVRQHRDKLLTKSDWTQLPDAPVDASAWSTYRQALRDVPQQADFPADVTWPEEPQ